MKKIYFGLCMLLYISSSTHAMHDFDPDEIEEVVFIDENVMVPAEKLENTLYAFRDIGNENPDALRVLKHHCIGLGTLQRYVPLFKRYKLIPPNQNVLDEDIKAIVLSAILVRRKEIRVKRPGMYGLGDTEQASLDFVHKKGTSNQDLMVEWNKKFDKKEENEQIAGGAITIVNSSKL